MGEWKLVRMVYVTWPKWRPCPYMVKTFEKSSLEPKCRWLWNSVYSIEYSCTTKFVQMMPLGWPYFMARSNLVPYASVWEKVETMDFSETCSPWYKRCHQLIEYVKVYEYQRSRPLVDLCPNHSDSIFLNFFSSITADFNISSVFRWAIQDQWSSGICWYSQIWCLVNSTL